MIYNQDGIIIHNGDCLNVLGDIDDNTFDAVITDPPYGTTACKWDTVIPLESMWDQLHRVTKERGAVVLFGGEPFSSNLRMSNIKNFKYDWIWNKVTARGHLVAKKRPMAQHEYISVFYRKAPTYNPQMVLKDKPQKGSSIEASRTSIVGGKTTATKKTVVRTHSYPKTILTFGMDKRVGHPTQKPVALMKYLIETYTNEGDTILDFTMGSGSTLVSARLCGRKAIGIEQSKEYCDIAISRLDQ